MRVLYWLRSLFATVCFVVLTGFFSTFALVCLSVYKSIALGDWVLVTWGRLALRIYNVKLLVEGTENIPANGCLFVFNHSSDFDILAIVAGIEKSARFGAKIELFSIPFFGAAMRIMGVLPITRSERGKVLKLYDESIARVLKGESFFLAAEGTRQPTAGVGEKFKSGPFIFAINGQFPLVPVVLYGVRDCLAKGDFIACTQHWQYTIRLRILPPISTLGLTEDDRGRLKADVREMMVKAYQELEQSVIIA